MSSVVAGFVDVGFVRAVVGDAHATERARVRLDAAAIVHLIDDVAHARHMSVLRTYWYDGQFLPDDPRFAPQGKYLEAVGQVPGIRLRLGSLLEREPSWAPDLRRALTKVGVDPATLTPHFNFTSEITQKGVDTLLVLDLVLLSQAHAYDTAVLFAGDRDLNEAVRIIQDQGRSVVLVVPPGRVVSGSLRALADDVILLTRDQVRSLQLARAPRPPAAQRAGVRPAAPAGPGALPAPPPPAVCGVTPWPTDPDGVIAHLTGPPAQLDAPGAELTM